MRLILVRHGETVANAEGIYQGWQDVPLNDLGERQATAVAGALAARRDWRPVALYASPLKRAWRTAEAIGAALGLAPAAHPGLREIDVGAAEGLTSDEVHRRWPELWEHRERLGLDYGWPGGETGWGFRARVVAAIDEIIARHRTTAGADDAVIVSTHGGTIRYALAYLRGDPPGPWPTDAVGNCSITEVLLGDEAARRAHHVVAINACDHLDERRREAGSARQPTAGRRGAE